MSAPTLERQASGRHTAESATTPSGRYAAWRGSWALALRMARRDARRHKGRSLLAVIMIGLPTALLAFALTANATSTVSGTELIVPLMGNGQAYVEAPTGSVIIPNPWGNGVYGMAGEAKPIPGYVGSMQGAVDAPPISDPRNVAAIEELTGAKALPIVSTGLRAKIGDHSVWVATHLTTRPQDLGPRLTLTSGRWPANGSEVVVTPEGERVGLRSGSTVTVNSNGYTAVASEPRTLATVGTAQPAPGPTAHTQLVGLVDGWPPEALNNQSRGWILHRDAPVTWAEAKSWAAYGLNTTSAEVLRHTPPDSEIPEESRQQHDQDVARARLFVVAGGALLLISTALLVGPAFAVGAARSRRTLALAASNGAETPQLRRTVLGQAVVLGVASAIGGAALGTLAALVLRLLPATRTMMGPFDVPWTQILGIVIASSVSAVVAALAPAQRLGRLDIVGVMRGQVVASRPSRGLFLVGAVLAAVGGIAVLALVANAGIGSDIAASAGMFGNEYAVVAATIFLVLGALLLVPTILHVAARIASVFPLAPRVALRDLDRHRTRSAPAVAAVVGVVSAFTVMGIGLTSDTRQQEQDYQPQTVLGEGIIGLPDGPEGPLPPEEQSRAAQEAEQLARQIQPSLVFTPVLSLANPWGFGIAPGAEAKPIPWLAVRADGCTLADTLGANPMSADGSYPILPEVDPLTGKDVTPVDRNNPEARSRSFTATEPKCQRLGSLASSNQAAIVGLPAATIVDRFSLTGAQAKAVRDGAAVVWAPKTTMSNDPTQLTLGWGTVYNNPQEGRATKPTQTGTAKIPVVPVAATRENLALFPYQSALILPTERATALGLTGPTMGLLVSDPSGAISKDVEERINATLNDAGYGLTVERGFQRQDALVMAILVGVMALLLLVVTLTTTALSVAEQQTDHATYAALGATRGTRRTMAAAAAYVTALLGVIIGMAVGAVPGVAISYPLTSNSFDPLTGAPTGGHVLAVPWLWFAIMLVVAPLVAAALAWAGIRRAPEVTRRAT